MIESTLTVSSAHLDPETAKYLGRGEYGMSDTTEYDGGWILFTDEVVNSFNEGNKIPMCIQNIAKLAILNGCSLIRIDRDGPIHSDLNKWDW